MVGRSVEVVSILASQCEMFGRRTLQFLPLGFQLHTGTGILKPIDHIDPSATRLALYIPIRPRMIGIDHNSATTVCSPLIAVRPCFRRMRVSVPRIDPVFGTLACQPCRHKQREPGYEISHASITP